MAGQSFHTAPAWRDSLEEVNNPFHHVPSSPPINIQGGQRTMRPSYHSPMDEDPSLLSRRARSPNLHHDNPNSIDNFARSWQRAASFLGNVSRSPSFVFAGPADVETPAGPGLGRERSSERRPLLPRFGDIDEYAVDTEDFVDVGNDGHSNLSPVSSRPSLESGNYYDAADFGASYGSMSSRISFATRQRTAQLHREIAAKQHFQHRSPTLMPAQNDEVESFALKQDRDTPSHLVVKSVEHENGTQQMAIVGQSTVPQTIFNSVNVLIGVGILSLPLALQYSGWLIGVTIFVTSAIVTKYTATLLARCMNVDNSLSSYGDLAYISFGSGARFFISILFCLELVATCVALVILFADSVDAMFPVLSITGWKLVFGVLLIPLSFLPLRFLSVTSILGIFCCTSIVLSVAVDGLFKPHAPGSLHDPAPTTLLPTNWNAVPLSFGLLMAPWGGHGVFPNIYKDMRHPHKYDSGLRTIFSFTFCLDFICAIVGWLMFGPEIADAVTTNVLLLDGYPPMITSAIAFFTAIIPLTKGPLNCRPIVSTLETCIGIGEFSAKKEAMDKSAEDEEERGSMSHFLHNVGYYGVRILTVSVFTLIAIVFPYFDRIMALMGAGLCTTICIVFPVAFHLKIFGDQIPWHERVMNWIILVVSSIVAFLGTAWAFLPREALGLE